MNSILFKSIIASFIIGASCGIYVGYKYNDGQHAIKTTATMTAQSSAVANARKDEQAIVKSYVDTSKTYQEGLNDGKKDLNAVIAKLRSDRVRNSSTSSASMPTNTTTASGRNAEERAYILEEMARLAGEADDVTKQLTAAQDLLDGRVAALQTKEVKQ